MRFGSPKKRVALGLMEKSFRSHTICLGWIAVGTAKGKCGNPARARVYDV
jgi:hypothetical protein